MLERPRLGDNRGTGSHMGSKTFPNTGHCRFLKTLQQREKGHPSYTYYFMVHYFHTFDFPSRIPLSLEPIFGFVVGQVSGPVWPLKIFPKIAWILVGKVTTLFWICFGPMLGPISHSNMAPHEREWVNKIRSELHDRGDITITTLSENHCSPVWKALFWANTPLCLKGLPSRVALNSLIGALRDL